MMRRSPRQSGEVLVPHGGRSVFWLFSARPLLFRTTFLEELVFQLRSFENSVRYLARASGVLRSFGFCAKGLRGCLAFFSCAGD